MAEGMSNVTEAMKSFARDLVHRQPYALVDGEKLSFQECKERGDGNLGEWLSNVTLALEESRLWEDAVWILKSVQTSHPLSASGLVFISEPSRRSYGPRPKEITVESDAFAWFGGNGVTEELTGRWKVGLQLYISSLEGATHVPPLNTYDCAVKNLGNESCFILRKTPSRPASFNSQATTIAAPPTAPLPQTQ